MKKMSGTRVAGGILGIIGGASILFAVLLMIPAVFGGPLNLMELIAYLLALTIGILALVGGIVSLASNSSGGAALLTGGIMAVACGVLWFILDFIMGLSLPFLDISGYGFLSDLLYANITFAGITIEGVLIFVGGILAIVGKE